MNTADATTTQHQHGDCVELRAHHLLCALTFRGRGYGPDFVHNFDRALQRIASGEPLRLVQGADSLCRSAHNCGHCDQPSSHERDALALAELTELLGSDLSQELRLRAATLKRLRQAFADQSLRAACRDCAWADLCSSVAAQGFRRARLQAPA